MNSDRHYRLLDFVRPHSHVTDRPDSGGSGVRLCSCIWAATLLVATLSIYTTTAMIRTRAALEELQYRSQESADQFRKVSSGSCAMHRLAPIRDPDTCEAAAHSLGLADTTAAFTNRPGRPEGCYYHYRYETTSQHPQESLWMSLSTDSVGNGAETSDPPRGTLRQPLCMAHPAAGRAGHGATHGEEGAERSRERAAAAAAATRKDGGGGPGWSLAGSLGALAGAWGWLRPHAAAAAGLRVDPFYIYDHPSMNTSALMECMPGDADPSVWPAYWAVTRFFLARLQNHESRVLDPGSAKFLIVPFDLDVSLHLDGRGNCSRCRQCASTHSERVNAAIDALEASPHFRRSGGRDHIWVAPAWILSTICPGVFGEGGCSHYIPRERRHVLRNMIVGRYISYHLNVEDRNYGFEPLSPEAHDEVRWWRNAQDWRCTLLLPMLSMRRLWRPDAPYGEWRARGVSLFFRGKGKPCANSAELLRRTSSRLRDIVPGSVIEDDHAPTLAQYEREITSSRFCLVMRCDDPQTSRFVDALAAGCIPIIVDDGFLLTVAPFTNHLNFQTFAVVIPESIWTNDTLGAAHFIYNWPESRLQHMHGELLRARRALLWHHPETETGLWALREAAEECPARRDG